jgi:hypothetical protein
MNEEKDHCLDCGAEFTGYHYCEAAYIRYYDEEGDEEE